MKVKKAIIPAAGLGTRLLPATKAQPKEMMPIVDKPTIQYIVEEAIQSGIEDILIVTGRGKRAIEDHFDQSYELEHELERKGKKDLLALIEDISNLVDIHYIRQKQAKGLGHAIYCARSFIGDQPFAVLLGDDVVYTDARRGEKPALRQLMEVYERFDGTVLGVQEVSPSQVNKYGIVRPSERLQDGLYGVKDLVEKPPVEQAPSNIAILGRYIISPALFPILEATQADASDEIQLTDALKTLARRRPMYAYEFKGVRYDLGDRQGYLRATVELALRREDLRDGFKAYLEALQNTELWKGMNG